MRIPKLVRNLRELEEENTQLTYEVERLENPKMLMKLMRKPEFSHLKQPLVSEVITVCDG